MKRTERHHLKRNPVAEMMVAARNYIEPRQRQLLGVLVAALVGVVVIAGVLVVRQQNQARADVLLAEAMVALNARVVPAGVTTGDDNLPAAATIGATGTFSTEEAKLTAALPKLESAADTYPGTRAGITSRYHLASALAALGRHDEAIAHFDEVTQRAGERSLYGRMARLGKADTHLRAGDYDAAIATWNQLNAQNDDALPKDAILMELARAYTAKGDTEEARRALTEIVDEHPDSVYSPQARTELENLKS